MHRRSNSRGAFLGDSRRRPPRLVYSTIAGRLWEKGTKASRKDHGSRAITYHIDTSVPRDGNHRLEGTEINTYNKGYKVSDAFSIRARWWRGSTREQQPQGTPKGHTAVSPRKARRSLRETDQPWSQIPRGGTQRGAHFLCARRSSSPLPPAGVLAGCDTLALCFCSDLPTTLMVASSWNSWYFDLRVWRWRSDRRGIGRRQKSSRRGQRGCSDAAYGEGKGKVTKKKSFKCSGLSGNENGEGKKRDGERGEQR